MQAPQAAPSKGRGRAPSAHHRALRKIPLALLSIINDSHSCQNHFMHGVSVICTHHIVSSIEHF